MKFRCDQKKINRAERLENRKKWHLWFALYPCKVGFNDCRWMEYVWRRDQQFEVWGFFGSMPYRDLEWGFYASPLEKGKLKVDFPNNPSDYESVS